MALPKRGVGIHIPPNLLRMLRELYPKFFGKSVFLPLPVKCFECRKSCVESCMVGRQGDELQPCFMMSIGHALPRNVCVGAVTTGLLQSQWAGGNLGSVPARVPCLLVRHWQSAVVLAEIRDGHHEMGPGLGTEQQGVQVLTISFHLVPILNRKQWKLPPKVVIAEMTLNSYNQGKGVVPSAPKNAACHRVLVVLRKQ